MTPLYALVMAGGSGTRFWPASRRAMPKQLLAIAPGSEHTLIGATIRRVEALCGPDQILIATGAHLVEATRRALPELRADAFLGEPVARNTAACIGWGTARVARRDPDALVMALPSDHHVGDAVAFRAAAAEALHAAAGGRIATIGIKPERPETGYGYIEAGAVVTGSARQVVRFVEKPDRVTAEEYVRSGHYFWNSGMFFFRARDMLRAIDIHMPELARGLALIEEAARRSAAEETTVTEAVFSALPSVSIDYGVMEKATDLAVVPGSFGWSDLGSWEAAYELSQKDASGNAVDSGVVLIDAERNLVRSASGCRQASQPKIIALVGVQDLCVVDTGDALLIMPRERAQDVREVVKALAEAGRDDLV